MTNNQNISLKAYIITGASSGIGFALAKKMAADGITVGLLARRKERLETLAQSIISQGGRAIVLCCDVCNLSDVKQAVEQFVNQTNRLDGIVLNAGGSLDLGPFFSSEAIKANFDLNVNGTLHGIDVALPIMQAQGFGHIVGISSMASYIPVSELGVYSACKKSINYIFEGLRRQLKGSNINLSLISPGYIKTPLTARNNYSMPGLMSLDKGSHIIYKAILAKKARVAFPFWMASVLNILQCLPSAWVNKLIGNKDRKKSTTPLRDWDIKKQT